MNKRILAVALVAACAIEMLVLFSHTRSESPNKYERAQKSTVLIEVSHGKGSGFIIQRGHRLFVFTAAHVVSHENVVKVHQVIRYENRKVGESLFSAMIIARDENLDLALLWLNAPPSYFEPTHFYSGPALPVGTAVYHVGNISGDKFDGSVTTGVISQIGISLPNFPWPCADQTTAILLPGCSGGPIFNTDGSVIGVAVAHYSPGVEFFVPLRAVVSFAVTQNVTWSLTGTLCPDDSALTLLALKSAYIAPPEPILDLTPPSKKTTLKHEDLHKMRH